MTPIHCILKVNGGANQHMLHAAIVAAYWMYRNEERSHSFEGRTFECRVTTDFATGSLGSYGGPIFTAELEHASGRATVRFIMDADGLAKAALIPEEDIEGWSMAFGAPIPFDDEVDFETVSPRDFN